jgi:sulfide:quinone oxidoreductase
LPARRASPAVSPSRSTCSSPSRPTWPPSPTTGFRKTSAASCSVKQAFLAFLQADAVAEHISGLVDGREPVSAFDPVSMCIMEMFDKATFAQVPLRLTGDPARPVEVRPDANGAYKVGVSPIWRLGKKMLGAVVPMRFHAGEPFHAGTAWQLMDIGLRGMKGVLAD